MPNLERPMANNRSSAQFLVFTGLQRPDWPLSDPPATITV